MSLVRTRRTRRVPLRSAVRWIVYPAFLLFAAGCAHLPVDKRGVWQGQLPEPPIQVKEAARVERPWYGKGVAPFAFTLISGTRTGLQWNEGRNLRLSEVVRGIPIAGWITVPYWCYEALTEQTMQRVANRTGIDETRKEKYHAIIKRLSQEGRNEEARRLEANSPFILANHPPNPAARIPPEKLDGFWNNTKLLATELLIGHRVALERNESRGIRKLEYFHPLILTRIWEAITAARGAKMEDIADRENLDEAYLPEHTSESQALAKTDTPAPASR